MAEDRTSSPVRLAMREEGNWWVAYVATTTNMEGAFEIGRIMMGAVTDAEIKDAFLGVMVEVMKRQLEGLGLKPVRFETRTAPESERSGRG